MHIVALNGPAGCGKDTLGNILASHYGYEVLRFKDKMFEIAKAVLGFDRYMQFMTLYYDRSTKEQPSDLLGGLSPRQFFIRISEEWLKPTFGQDVFGQHVADRIAEIMARPCNWGDPGVGVPGPRNVVITDGGFFEEMTTIQCRFPQFRVARLYREGFTFEGDSRNYIYGVPGFSVYLEDDKPRQAADYIHSVMLGIKK